MEYEILNNGDSVNVFGELCCLLGPYAGKKWKITAENFTIGRLPENEVCIPEVPGISRIHCRIGRKESKWSVSDCNSRYWTFLQNPGNQMVRLIPEKDYLLVSGAILYLGGNKFCLSISFFQPIEDKKE